jgi:Flp pilus assembly protein TadG
MTSMARRDERGGAATEIVLMTPVLLLLLLFVALCGRYAVARGQIDGAARDSARAAALTRSAGDAEAAAQASADADLASTGLPCDSITTEVDASDFRPGGTVRVRLVCEVQTSDLGLLGVGPRTMTASSVAVVDLFRGVDGG